MKRNRVISRSKPAGRAPWAVRQGTSLIEVVVAMGIAGVVLTMGVGTLHLLLGSERAASKEVALSRSVSRLSQLFRQDVHSAANAEIQPVAGERPVTSLKLTRGESRTVEYRVDAAELTRVETEGEIVRHRDAFRFSPDTTITFERVGQPDLIGLKIARPLKSVAAGKPGAGSNVKARRRSLRIEALLNRGSRLSGIK